MIAILGVIVLPVSSGLSGFRSLRTILADYLSIPQDSLKKVLAVTIPLFVVSFFLTMVDFQLIWRYFNWANQVTAVIALFVATRYLYLKGRNWLVTFVPGSLMLYAVFVYILTQPIGFNMALDVTAYILAAILTVGLIALFWYSGSKQKDRLSPQSPLLNDHLPIEEVRRLQSQS